MAASWRYLALPQMLTKGLTNDDSLTTSRRSRWCTRS
jgi:hypothetical protein